METKKKRHRDATYVFNALDGVVVGDLNGSRLGLLLTLLVNDLTQFVPPKVAQRRRTGR